MNYIKEFGEIACVGAGIGGGFENTSELHVVKYEAAMNSPDAAKWTKAVEEEDQRMEENGVWSPVPKSEVPADAKILTSTWAMKKKSNGTYRARLNGRGFEQVPGIHFDPKSIAAPVVSMMTIRIIFIITIMAGWSAHVVDVRGAFLKGDFAEGETLYLHVPRGMEKWYDGGEIMEFIGCKIDYDRTNNSMRFTQPVLLQSFADEFAMDGNDKPNTPGVPMKTLQMGERSTVEGRNNTYYRSGVGKRLYLKRWSRPEMANALRIPTAQRNT